MAFEEHELMMAREEAEKRFTADEIAAARLLMDAYTFHILDILSKSVASSLKYFSDREKKIDRMMGKIKYDMGPDSY